MKKILILKMKMKSKMGRERKKITHIKIFLNQEGFNYLEINSTIETDLYRDE